MFGFLIPACVRNKEHEETIRICINSIRKWYPNNLIVIIVDFTSLDINFNDKNIIIENEKIEVPADMLTYYYFYKNKYTDRMIMIQDSMRLLRKFTEKEIDSKEINYLWRFTNHRIQWSIIKEPETEYNRNNGIVVHDDLVKHCIDIYCQGDFKKYCIEMYDKKNNWSGCFGCCAVMNLTFLNLLQEKTDIIEIMKKMTDNRKRRAIESIFSLACQYTLNKEIHDSIDGLYFDGINSNNLKTNLIEKVSHNR